MGLNKLFTVAQCFCTNYKLQNAMIYDSIIHNNVAAELPGHA